MTFDFRDMLGGASGKLEKDPKLADGASAEYAPGLHFHLLEKSEGADGIVEMMVRATIYNANSSNICVAALLALMVGRMAKIAGVESNAHERGHVIAEVRAMLDALDRGER